MRALEIFDTDEHGKLGGSLAEILRLADPPASRLVWTLRYIEARDDVSAAWPAGLKDLEAQASARKFGLELSWEQLPRSPRRSTPRWTSGSTPGLAHPRSVMLPASW